MPVKKLIATYEKKHCVKCDQPIKVGDEILWAVGDEIYDPIVSHFECPPLPPGAKGRKQWHRRNPPKQIPKIEVRCSCCEIVYSVEKAKGFPLHCDFCGAYGSVTGVLVGKIDTIF
jgi:hypothetical protein